MTYDPLDDVVGARHQSRLTSRDPSPSEAATLASVALRNYGECGGNIVVVVVSETTWPYWYVRSTGPSNEVNTAVT